MTPLRETGIRLEDLLEDQLTVLEIDGRMLILTFFQGRPVAFSGCCPHAAGDLSQGALRRGRIDCPVHGWRFDIVTGRTLFPPDESCRLRRFDTEVQDSRVLIRLP